MSSGPGPTAINHAAPDAAVDRDEPPHRAMMFVLLAALLLPNGVQQVVQQQLPPLAVLTLLDHSGRQPELRLADQGARC